jgi:hypothetical protein
LKNGKLSGTVLTNPNLSKYQLSKILNRKPNKAGPYPSNTKQPSAQYFRPPILFNFKLVRIFNRKILKVFRIYFYVFVDDSRAMVNGHPRTSFELNLPRCALLFDGHSIIEAEGLNWKLADNDLDLKQERISFGCEVLISVKTDIFFVRMVI